MKKTLLLTILLMPIYYGCTLLDIESSKTETVTSTENEDQNQIQRLEARIEELEKRLSKIERNSQ